MTATDPAPKIPIGTLGFNLPPECEPGFAFNLRLLEQHWTVLRQAQTLIAAHEAKA